jgi:hypothetical protein
LPENTVLQSTVIILNYIRYGSKYQGQEDCNFIAVIHKKGRAISDSAKILPPKVPLFREKMHAHPRSLLNATTRLPF